MLLILPGAIYSSQELWIIVSAKHAQVGSKLYTVQVYMHLQLTQVLHVLNTFIQESTELSYDMIHVTRLLLSNQQGGSLAQLAVSPNQPPLCRTLSGIVIHCASVMLSRTDVSLLQSFLYMLNNPAALEVR